MAAMKRWNVEVVIDEHDNVTWAQARLTPGDGVALKATGTARRNPADVNVPGIGDELAVARALAELAHLLLHTASADIQSVTHQPAELTR